MKIQNYHAFKQKFPLDSLVASSLRSKAYDRFEKNGLPSKKEESWKYTSINDFLNQEWSFPIDEHILLHEELKWLSSKLSADFYNYVFVNGQINRTLSDDFEGWIKIKEANDLDMKETTIEGENKFYDLSLAGTFEKIYFHLSAGQIIDKPVQFLFVQKSEGHVFVQPRIEISLSKNSQAQIIYNFLSLENRIQNKDLDFKLNSNAINIETQINLEKNANLKFIQVQNENNSDFHFSRTICKLDSGSEFVSLHLALGGKLARHYLQVSYHGENASAGLFGLTALQQNQHTDHLTYIHHVKGSNHSIQHYKSVLADQSHSVFRGRVRIDPQAQKANSEQLNNNLLLSSQAQADSIPQLEIFADDVKASHGSTMGQLNSDELFYLISRGINQKKAVRMLAMGFSLDLINKIENTSIREWIIQNVNEKLESMMPHD